MPTFCRHNRLLQNCTICAREQDFEARPVVSSSAPGAARLRERERPGPDAASERARTARPARPKALRASVAGVRVRRLARGAEDGYRSPLVPGLKSSEEAARLAAEVAYSGTRLVYMAGLASGQTMPQPPAAWLEVATPGGAEARTLHALRYVLEGARARAAGQQTEDAVIAFEAWGARQGSLPAAFVGEPSWTAERRFERIFERLGGIRGYGRDVRFELLTLLGYLGVYELRSGRLFLGGENEVTWAAKRAFGIGDQMLLDRRASELAAACGVPLDALDLALHSWGSGTRLGEGLPEVLAGEYELRELVAQALGI